MASWLDYKLPLSNESEETLPSLAEFYEGIQKGVNEYLPNPMRPLENPYNPGEHVTRAMEIAGSPVSGLTGAAMGAIGAFSPRAKSEIEKAMVAIAPLLAGAGGGRIPKMSDAKAGMKLATEANPEGYVTFGPSVARAGMESLKNLKKSDPEFYDFITRSNYEYGHRAGTRSEAEGKYGVTEAKDVGGWSEETPRGSMASLIDDVVEKHGGQGNRWQLGANVHEDEHAVMRELKRLRTGSRYDPVTGHYGPQQVGTGIPGTKQSERFRQYLAGLGTKANPQYPPDHMPREIGANTIERRSLGAYNDEGGSVFDQRAFDRFKKDVIGANTQWKNDPLILVDPNIENLPGPKLEYDDFIQKETMKAKYAERDRLKQEAYQRQLMLKRHGKDFSDAFPAPKGPTVGPELQELLSQLDEDIPLTGPSFRNVEQEVSRRQGMVQPSSSSGRSYPISAGEMPSEVADYVMRKFTPLHEEIPNVKEMKRKGLTNFMDWWQSASDDDRRMYAKMIKTTAEEAPAPQPRSEPRYQQMTPTQMPHAEKKRARNEQLRLQNIAGLRKK